MSFAMAIKALIVLGLLGGFFVWVLFQMAWASESMWRLTKLGGALAAGALGAPLVYLLLAPLRRG